MIESMEILLDQLEKELQKLLRAFKRLRGENHELRKQMAVLEMEHTMLQDKYNEANLQIMNLTNQLGRFEVNDDR